MDTFSLKGKGFERPPQGLQAQVLTVTVSLFTMRAFAAIRFTIPITDTKQPYECAIIPHVPYLDLNTDKKDKIMTKSLFFLRQPMLIYADVCAPGFLYKMLFETIAFHSANEIGQKQRISFHKVSVVVQRICVLIWTSQNQLVHVPEVRTVLYCIGHCTYSVSLWRVLY